ncbi:hypothetical protein FEM48_Zijuj07G0131400 [Ziziphus jujuba var. spinosa]|uniref:Peptidase A1 domain-containing protein n=1 Tax=Ziziphus jujuba var. spinosa TaxID=714518 RepID=A0A978V4T9_ZIZJJ|nr:hypothetical protein FEM48_Zijuj07G0131400 [Ziziphus jujuba var. spinosa]
MTTKTPSDGLNSHMHFITPSYPHQLLNLFPGNSFLILHSFLLFSSLLFPIISLSTAQTSFRPKALLLPVTKDSSTLQYLTQINRRTPLVPIKLTLDLGSAFLWVDCEQDNSVTHSDKAGVLAQDVVAIQSNDGSKPGRVVSVPNLLFTCGSSFLLKGLASGVKGMAGLGRTNMGLPSQFSAAFNFHRKFAICLSSSTRSNGVVFFGDGPYMFPPGNFDESKSLTYTPLFINPVSTAGSFFPREKSTEYFIGVKSIKIDNQDVPLNTLLLSIDSKGYGGTKISTVKPYTVLESSIYNSMVNAFVKSLGNHVKRVAAVPLFGACFDSRKIGSTPVGPGVPTINLVLQSESVYWTIYGANSMVEVGKDVLCLGFLDGGHILSHRCPPLTLCCRTWWLGGYLELTLTGGGCQGCDVFVIRDKGGREVHKLSFHFHWKVPIGRKSSSD